MGCRKASTSVGKRGGYITVPLVVSPMEHLARRGPLSMTKPKRGILTRFVKFDQLTRGLMAELIRVAVTTFRATQ